MAANLLNHRGTLHIHRATIFPVSSVKFHTSNVPRFRSIVARFSNSQSFCILLQFVQDFSFKHLELIWPCIHTFDSQNITKMTQIRLNYQCWCTVINSQHSNNSHRGLVLHSRAHHKSPLIVYRGKKSENEFPNTIWDETHDKVLRAHTSF